MKKNVINSFKATVIMPVYNCEKYLHEAIDSILNQSYTDFEFIIINDGSTDQSKVIIDSFKDIRINYIENEVNLGLITTLNKGLKMAKGEYIFRMDADDIAYPDRIEKQIFFMESNKNIAISGTWFIKTGKHHFNTFPDNQKECQLQLLNNVVLGHPTVIIRKKALLEAGLQYKHSAIHAEDYRLWADAVMAGLQISNIPHVLLTYRIHPDQISSLKYDILQQTVADIRIDYAKFFFGSIIESNKVLYSQLMTDKISDYHLHKKAKELVLKLLEINTENKNFDQKKLKNLYKEHLNQIAFNTYISSNKGQVMLVFKAMFDKHYHTISNYRQTVKYILNSIFK